LLTLTSVNSRPSARLAGRLRDARSVSERAIIRAGRMTIREAITSEDCDTSNGPILPPSISAISPGRYNDSMSA
jgi:hypothetical protein